MGRVVYVTGAPASGKSTTTAMMLLGMDGVSVWEYGARLTAHLRAGGVDVADQDELRRQSSRLAVAKAVDEVDDQLLAFVAATRGRGHVLIDSHPVTREHHGLRITAFSHEHFRHLAPDEIWCFYTAPEVAVETARMHTILQASVAAAYGIAAGCPVYLFDTDREQAGLVAELRARLLS